MAEMPVPWKVPIPAWYQLGIFRKTTLTISVHPKALPMLDAMEGKAPFIKRLQEEFDLPDFIPPSAKRWGYGQMLETVPGKEGWTTFRCQLPVGKGPLETEASGWVYLKLARCTLSVLFQALFIALDEDTDYRVPQLIIVEPMVIKDGPQGGAISAILTPAMNSFLSCPTERDLKSIERAMRNAYYHMWQGKKEGRLGDYFRVIHQEPTVIHLSVFGGGIDPASNFGRYEGPTRGYKLVSHNVDGGLQQLALLMGLARLHELGRRKYL